LFTLIKDSLFERQAFFLVFTFANKPKLLLFGACYSCLAGRQVVLPSATSKIKNHNFQINQKP